MGAQPGKVRFCFPWARLGPNPSEDGGHYAGSESAALLTYGQFKARSAPGAGSVHPQTGASFR